MERIAEDGFAPNGYTYLGLLRACASACDLPRAQRVLTRMLDGGLEPRPEHFHVLLHGCRRLQVWGAEDDAEEALRVALSVPASMAALGMEVRLPAVAGAMVSSVARGSGDAGDAGP